MVLVAILAIVAIAIITMKTPSDIAPSITGDVDVNITWPEMEDFRTEHVEIPVDLDPAKRVLLVDKSGSMANILYGNVSYDVVVPFSDYIGSENSRRSQICSCLTLALDMGVKEIGLATDLEVYPASDYEAFEGRMYYGREVNIFLPEDVDETEVRNFVEALMGILDEETCTLIINYAGQNVAVFNNYDAKDDVVAESDIKVSPEKVLPNVTITDDRCLEAGNYVAPSYVRNLWILFTVVTAILAEIILALLLRRQNGAGGDQRIVDAVSKADGIALDGSGSVSNVYHQLLGYVERQGRSTVWRFADSVETLSLKEAKSRKAGGQTAGYECLKKMYKAGLRSILIASDMGFNDTYDIEGIHFQRITFVVPVKHSQEMINDLAKLADETEIIYL